jgi:hypothetical protein
MALAHTNRMKRSHHNRKKYLHIHHYMGIHE